VGWLLSAAIGLAAGLAAVELALRRRAPVRDPYRRVKRPANPFVPSEHPRQYQAELRIGDDIPGVAPHGRFTTNNVGLRGDRLDMPKPAGEQRVILVGDSVIECMFLDDDAALSRVLQDALNAAGSPGPLVRVYGAGRSRDKSDEHLALVTQRLLHLEPDLLIVCSAVNDLMASLTGHDYRHLELPPALAGPRLARMLVTESQLGRRLSAWLTRLPAEADDAGEVPVLRSQNHARVERRRSAPPAARRPQADVETYTRNLTALVGAARANGVAVVLMTQPCTWSAAGAGLAEAEWRLQRGGATYPRDLMAAEMERLNAALRGIAARQGVPIYDAARLLPLDREWLYDDVHLTVAGARRVGHELAALVRREHVKDHAQVG
jgi:lysophospholipase L1-like esterase